MNEQEQQLRILRESKTYLLFFIAALFLSYAVTSIQEKQLLCALEDTACPCLPDTCPMRFTATLLSFWALIYFYIITAGPTSCSDSESQPQQNRVSYAGAASLLSLLAGALRLFDVISECLSPQKTSQ